MRARDKRETGKGEEGCEIVRDRRKKGEKYVREREKRRERRGVEWIHIVGLRGRSRMAGWRRCAPVYVLLATIGVLNGMVTAKTSTTTTTTTTIIPREADNGGDEEVVSAATFLIFTYNYDSINLHVIPCHSYVIHIYFVFVLI